MRKLVRTSTIACVEGERLIVREKQEFRINESEAGEIHYTTL